MYTKTIHDSQLKLKKYFILHMIKTLSHHLPHIAKCKITFFLSGEKKLKNRFTEKSLYLSYLIIKQYLGCPILFTFLSITFFLPYYTWVILFSFENFLYCCRMLNGNCEFHGKFPFWSEKLATPSGYYCTALYKWPENSTL